jgi:hypothetical protein
MTQEPIDGLLFPPFEPLVLMPTWFRVHECVQVGAGIKGTLETHGSAPGAARESLPHKN